MFAKNPGKSTLIFGATGTVPIFGSDAVCLVIASPAQPGVAIQLDCFVVPAWRDSSQ
jgi:hypothetical protein